MLFKNAAEVPVHVGPDQVYVEAGGTFEAVGEAADRLLEQPSNWTRVDKPGRRGRDEPPASEEPPPSAEVPSEAVPTE